MTLARTILSVFGVRPEVFRPIVEQLSAIAAPTPLVWDKQDPILPVAHAQIATKGLPNARLHIV